MRVRTLLKKLRELLALNQNGKTLKNDKMINGKHILIACFPKSGSTYLSKLLSEVTGYRLVSLFQYAAHNEQDLNKHTIYSNRCENTVTQQHVKGTFNNLKLIKSHNILPIVLVRNIYDTVISLHDHLEMEDHMCPTGYVHREYFNMSKEDKLMYLIKIHLPWYFCFLVSWEEVSRKTNVLWLSYEEVFSDVNDAIFKICKFCDVSINNEKIEVAINSIKQKNTRKNIGISGRGEQLKDIHKLAIEELASCWQMSSALMEKICVVD